MSEKKQEGKINLSRRDFLRATGGAVAMAGITTGGLVWTPGTASAAELPKKWDEEWDVVIIGSGFAGLAAAIEARKAGASAMVFEKMGVPGGNSTINGGVMAVAGSPTQEKRGLKDSPEKLVEDMLAAGLHLNHLDLVNKVAEQSREILDWTIEELKVKYMEDLVPMGGHSVPRSYCTYNRSGSAWVLQQIARSNELGAKIRTRAYLTRLFRDKDGRVKGVQIRDNYRFSDKSSGTEKYIKAAKAVILAAGGFGNDLSFRTVQDPRLTKEVDSTNQPGATAEALIEAIRIGATPVQLSWIQLGPWASPDEKGFGVGPHFAAGVAFVYGVMVDPETGKRFVNELADRKIRADAMIKTGKPSVAIADADAVKGREMFAEKAIDQGVVKKFNTLDELASAYGIPVGPLKETVEKYNAFIRQGEDKQFGKYLQEDAKPIAAPPFHAIRLWPKVHHCMGGVQVNTAARIIELAGEPIPGLYGAGEFTGGIHGASRLGSCATLECLVFGRTAGKNAAAEKAWT